MICVKIDILCILFLHSRTALFQHVSSIILLLKGNILLLIGCFTSFAQNLHDVVVSQNFIIELRPMSFSELASLLSHKGRWSGVELNEGKKRWSWAERWSGFLEVEYFFMGAECFQTILRLDVLNNLYLFHSLYHDSVSHFLRFELYIFRRGGNTVTKYWMTSSRDQRRKKEISAHARPPEQSHARSCAHFPGLCARHESGRSSHYYMILTIIYCCNL